MDDTEPNEAQQSNLVRLAEAGRLGLARAARRQAGRSDDDSRH
jgi:hypothetical protein